jgi:hypothetical protein
MFSGVAQIPSCPGNRLDTSVQPADSSACATSAGVVPKLFGILMLAAGVLAAPAAAQIVQGSVVNSITGAGLAGVKVELFYSGDLAYTTTSDTKGRLLFDHVMDGAYTAQYTAPDYEYEDMFRQPSGPRTFRVTAGGNPVELLAHMMPMGRLSGRVVDGTGKPVPKALVEVAGPGMQMMSPTDNEGKFDLHKFMFGGGYTFSVAPPAGLKPPDPEPESGQVLAWARTYYPGVTDPQAASKIDLPPGGELWDLVLKLKAVPAHAVRGTALNPDGTPAAKVAIQLAELGIAAPLLKAESKSDGKFEFPAVVDGHWRLWSEVDRGGVKLRASQWLEMAGDAREGVKLQLSAPFTVRGKVWMETPQGAAPPRARYLDLSLVNPTGETGLPRMGQVLGRPDEDGNFTLDQVYPGTYRIGTAPTPGYYMDGIRFGETELTKPEVELTSGAAAITLEFKTNGGTVRGTVEDCASGGVVLAPQDPAVRWPDSLRQARCDSINRYEITALRPGDYYVVAIAKDDSTIFWNAQWDDGLINQAAKITVRAGEATAAGLRAIPQAVH